MKILVPVRAVADSSVPVRLLPDGQGIDLAGVPRVLNPYDEHALEAALRLREAGVAQAVLAVSCGDADAEAVLRRAMAMGADRALLVETAGPLQPLGVARLLAAVCRSESPDLLICGKQSVGEEAGQTGPMLAGLLGWPQAHGVTSLMHEQTAEGLRLLAGTDVADGQAIRVLALPAVLTVDVLLNVPRFVSLPGILQARRKPVPRLAAESLGVDFAPRLVTLRYERGQRVRQGVRLPDVRALADCLLAGDGHG